MVLSSHNRRAVVKQSLVLCRGKHSCWWREITVTYNCLQNVFWLVVSDMLFFFMSAGRARRQSCWSLSRHRRSWRRRRRRSGSKLWSVKRQFDVRSVVDPSGGRFKPSSSDLQRLRKWRRWRRSSLDRKSWRKKQKKRSLKSKVCIQWGK